MSGHEHRGSLSGRKYLEVTVLNGLITIVQFAGGIFSGSLSLLSDAVHNFGDTVSIVLSYAAWKIAGRPNDPRRTYGYKRAEIIAAFVNAGALLAISAFIIFEAARRLRDPETIHSGVMIVVALFGLAANFIAMLALKKEAHGNMNVRSSYLHLLGDTISSVGVLCGGIAIRVWGVTWVDPLVSVLIAVYIMRGSWDIVKESVIILMQSAAALDYTAMQADIKTISGVRSVHHVHTWMSNEDTIYFEAHVELDDQLLSNACAVSMKIENILREKYGIAHATIQMETDRCAAKEFFHQ